MYFTETMTQRLALVDVLNSQAVNNAAVTSLGVDMSRFKRIFYHVHLVSTVAGTGTLDGRLQGSANANFNPNTNITGTNITTLNTNGTSETVEIRADQLAQANNTYKYVRLQLTDAVNSATCLAFGWATDAEQNPASQYNLNTVYLTLGTVCNL